MMLGNGCWLLKQMICYILKYNFWALVYSMMLTLMRLFMTIFTFASPLFIPWVMLNWTHWVIWIALKWPNPVRGSFEVLKASVHLNEPPYLIKQNFSLWTYYSGWMSCSISFVWGFAEQYGAAKSEKFKMKIYISSRIRTSNLRTALKANIAP